MITFGDKVKMEGVSGGKRFRSIVEATAWADALKRSGYKAVIEDVPAMVRANTVYRVQVMWSE